VCQLRALPVANPGDGLVITSFIDDTQEGLNKDQIFLSFSHVDQWFFSSPGLLYVPEEKRQQRMIKSLSRGYLS
jgi:hypothetical protein